jgi:twitching motility protein PilT
MIREGREHQIYSAIQTGKAQGMQTRDQALAELFLQGRITKNTLMQY